MTNSTAQAESSGENAAHSFHRTVPGYRPTRVVELATPPEWGVARTIVKLETARFGLPSFKPLGASWASVRVVARWLAARGVEIDGPGLGPLRTALGQLPQRPSLVAATDGNHGRAVAWIANLLGLRAEIFVPEGTAAVRAEAIRGEGAAVWTVSGDYDATVGAAAESTDRDRLLVQDTAVAGHERAPADVTAGYVTIFSELDVQLGPASDGRILVVVPVGVGSLAAAAARHYRHSGNTVLITVEPEDADSLRRSLRVGRPVQVFGPHRSAMVGLRCGSVSPTAWPDLASSVGEAVALPDAAVDDAMKDLAGMDIEVGECGAAPLAAVRQLARAGRLMELAGDWPTTVVLIATEAPTDPERWTSVVGRPPRPDTQA